MSFENVVLSYAHPHIAIYLEDNTIYTDDETEAVVNPDFNGIQVGFFGGGRDNTVIYCRNTDEFVNEFFNPNYKLYGQAGYNAIEALKTNQCGMYIMRLLPDDATYANVTVMVKYKATDVTTNDDTTDTGIATYAEGDDVTGGTDVTDPTNPDDTTGDGTGDGTGDNTGDTTPTDPTDPTNPDEGNTGDGGTGDTNPDNPENPDTGDGNTGDGTGDTDPTDPDDPTNPDDPGDVTDPNATKVLDIDFVAAYVTEATTLAELKTKVAALYTDEVDGEGYKTVPLMSFWQTGRGAYGNGTRVKFVDNTDYDYDDNTYHGYTINVMEYTINGLTIRERLNGTFSEDVLDADNDTNPSLFFEEVINDPEYGSQKINVIVHTDGLEELVAAYNEVAATYTDNESVQPMTVESLDVIFGMNMDGTINPAIRVAESLSLNIIATDGFALQGGSDGSIDASNPDCETVREELLIKAFTTYAPEALDSTLISRYTTPANFCLDANFPLNVKRQMGAWALNREYDAMTYVDTGLLTTSTEVIRFLQDLSGVTANNLVKEAGCYDWRDVDYTGKIIPMTVTHYIARKLPIHIAVNQYSTPFAREDATLVAGKDYVKNSFKPLIDPSMNDVKAKFYKLGANCYESIYYGKVQRSTGVTSITYNSDRRLEFNEYILQRAVYIAYSILNSKLYKIGEEEQRLQYQKHAEKEISYQLGSYLRSIEVAFVMSAKDEKRSIMRLRLRMVFKTVITRGIIEIYLDPRTTTATTTA